MIQQPNSSILILNSFFKFTIFLNSEFSNCFLEKVDSQIIAQCLILVIIHYKSAKNLCLSFLASETLKRILRLCTQKYIFPNKRKNSLRKICQDTGCLWPVVFCQMTESTNLQKYESEQTYILVYRCSPPQVFSRKSVLNKRTLMLKCNFNKVDQTSIKMILWAYNQD